jgi:hypothetical protein
MVTSGESRKLAPEAPAKPCTPVRFRSPPPELRQVYRLFRGYFWFDRSARVGPARPPSVAGAELHGLDQQQNHRDDQVAAKGPHGGGPPPGPFGPAQQGEGPTWSYRPYPQA